MATAASDVTVADSPAEGTKIFDSWEDGGGCRTYMIRCREDSENDVLVRVKNLHKPGEFFLIPAGSEQYFRAGLNDITEIYAKGDGGNASIDHGTVAK